MYNFFVIFSLIIFGLFIYFIQRNRYYLNKNSKNYNIVWSRKFLKNLLFILAYFILVSSVVSFSFDIFLKTSKPISWNDIIFVLDTSKSMDVIDLNNSWQKISRLEFSKKLISDFIKNNPNNSYWLVAFAWDASIVSPLTQEFDTYLNFLQSLNSNFIKDWWTDFAKMLEISIWNSWKTWKNIVILSDWWDKEDSINTSSIKILLKDKKVKIFTLWIWTLNWDKIPNWTDFFWNTQYKTYNWQEVVSFLNEKNLKDIASIWNWEYNRQDNLVIPGNITKNFINSLNKKSTQKEDETKRYLVILSFVLLVIAYFIPDKKKYSI